MPQLRVQALSPANVHQIAPRKMPADFIAVNRRAVLLSADAPRDLGALVVDMNRIKARIERKRGAVC